MEIYVDLQSRQIVDSPNYKEVVKKIELKRGDTEELEINFIDGDEITTLSGDILINFGIKSSGDYDGDFLSFANTFDLVGDSYVLSTSLNTETLDALFTDGDSSVLALGEITWSIDNGSTWSSSDTFKAKIYNDLIKGDEGTPTALPSASDWLDARAVRYDQEQDLTSDEQTQARDNIGAIDQSSIDTIQGELDTHTGNTSNPHSVTASQVGLGNVDNTADTDKPISTATQSAIDGVSNNYAILLNSLNDEIADRTNGDFTNALSINSVLNDLTTHTSNTSNPHNVTASQVGLDQVDNTSDLDKPISTATQTALNGYASTLDLTAEVGNLEVAIDEKENKLEFADLTSSRSLVAADLSTLISLDNNYLGIEPIVGIANGSWFSVFTDALSYGVHAIGSTQFVEKGGTTGTSVSFNDTFDIVTFVYIGGNQWIISANGVLS